MNNRVLRALELVGVDRIRSKWGDDDYMYMTGYDVRIGWGMVVMTAALVDVVVD